MNAQTLLMAGVVTACIAGCGGGGSSSGYTMGGGTTGGTTGGGLTASIATVNNSSAPMGFSFTSPVTVKSGTSVTWVNQSSAPHSIVWDAQSPSASPAPGAGIGVFSPGATSSAWIAPTVTVSTTYNYHCGIHGPTMAGQVTVTP